MQFIFRHVSAYHDSDTFIEMDKLRDVKHC